MGVAHGPGFNPMCRFGLVHKFLWDRYRAVRQDLYVQGITVRTGAGLAMCARCYGLEPGTGGGECRETAPERRGAVLEGPPWGGGGTWWRGCRRGHAGPCACQSLGSVVLSSSPADKLELHGLVQDDFAIAVYEEVVRFHIMCEHELCNEDQSGEAATGVGKGVRGDSAVPPCCWVASRACL